MMEKHQKLEQKLKYRNPKFIFRLIFNIIGIYELEYDIILASTVILD